MFVRVDPKASDSSSTRGKMRRHSTFTIPDKRSSVVEVELGEIRNHTALRVEDDEDMDEIGISTKESGDSDDSKEEDDDGTTTRLLIRRDSKGKLGIRFDDELVIVGLPGRIIICCYCFRRVIIIAAAVIIERCCQRLYFRRLEAQLLQIVTQQRPH